MKQIILRLFLNYLHRITSRFDTCSAYYVSKRMQRFNADSQLCPLRIGLECYIKPLFVQVITRN
jgi:hypothetical protein